MATRSHAVFGLARFIGDLMTAMLRFRLHAVAFDQRLATRSQPHLPGLQGQSEPHNSVCLLKQFESLPQCAALAAVFTNPGILKRR